MIATEHSIREYIWTHFPEAGKDLTIVNDPNNPSCILIFVKEPAEHAREYLSSRIEASLSDNVMPAGVWVKVFLNIPGLNKIRAVRKPKWI